MRPASEVRANAGSLRSPSPGARHAEIAGEHRIGGGEGRREHDRAADRQARDPDAQQRHAGDADRHHHAEQEHRRPPLAQREGMVEPEPGREQGDDDRPLADVLDDRGVVHDRQPGRVERRHAGRAERAHAEVDHRRGERALDVVGEREDRHEHGDPREGARHHVDARRADARRDRRAEYVVIAALRRHPVGALGQRAVGGGSSDPRPALAGRIGAGEGLLAPARPAAPARPRRRGAAAGGAALRAGAAPRAGRRPRARSGCRGRCSWRLLTSMAPMLFPLPGHPNRHGRPRIGRGCTLAPVDDLAYASRRSPDGERPGDA